MSNPDVENGRTHEPSLRELTAELDGLRDIMNERDRLYTERDKARERAVDAALAAQEKATSVAMTAADRAVAKVETANEKRFEAVNEFRGQLADQAATFLPRSEADIRFEGQNEKIDSLRATRERGAGAHDQEGMSRAQANFNWNLATAVILGLAAIVAAYIATHH